MHINHTWKYCNSCQRRAGWPHTRKCVECKEDEYCCLFAKVEFECDGLLGHDVTFYTCSVKKKVHIVPAKKVNGTMCNTQSTIIENEVAFIGINYQEIMVEVSVIMGIGLVILLCTLLGCKWRKNRRDTREMRRRLQNMERPPRQRFNQGHINGGLQGGQQRVVQGGLPPAYEGELNQNFNLGEGEFNLQNIGN